MTAIAQKPITEETFAAARKMNTAALAEVLSAGYAPARRIAHALSGNDAVGRAIAGVLVQRSLALLPRWRSAASAENWFYHHAVLTTRTVEAVPADPALDPLVLHSLAAAEPAYVAFIRALRHLPPQQREAFILHHGERLNPRLLGVAMDCSTGAAETHLQAATAALDIVSQDRTQPLADMLTGAYAKMQEAQPDAAPVVRVHVARARRRRWLRGIVRFLLIMLVLAGVAYAAWFFRDFWLPYLR